MKLPILILLLALPALACGVAAPLPAVMADVPATVAATMPAPATQTPQNSTENDFRYATVTASDWLHVRNLPSHRGDVVGYLMRGEQVLIYECFGLWAKVGDSRYVNSLYLSERCE